jgi:hypothetical protein
MKYPAQSEMDRVIYFVGDQIAKVRNHQVIS